MRRTTIRLLAAGALLLAAGPRPPAAADEADALRVSITRPRAGQTDERVLAIEGQVTGLPAGRRATLVLNGVALSIPVENGAFSTRQVLAPGRNTIRVVAEGAGRTASDEVQTWARVPAKDLRVTLTWDTAGTDVDLWVTGPDGEKVYYQNPQGKAGGTLDVDVTTGYGPETWTQARAVPGTYRVQAHYYRGDRPSRITLTVTRGEGTAEEEREVFRGVLLKTNDVVEVGEFTVER